MNAWPLISLGEIMPERSGTIEPSKFLDEMFDLYSVPAFDTGVPAMVEGKRIGSAKQIVQPGDVLLSKIVPHIRRAWIVGKDQGRRLIASSEWIVFRDDRFWPDFLRHILVSDPFHAKFMSTVSGVGGSLLRARPAHVAQIKIPEPPLPEQRRIAAIMGKAENLQSKRRLAVAKLDTLTQSLFIDLFGDPVDNPMGWPVKTVSSFVEAFQGGKSVLAESSEEAPTKNRVLKVSAVTNLVYKPIESKPVPDDYAPPPDHFVQEGDLLFSRANTTQLVGAVVYVWKTPSNLLLPDKLWRFVWKQSAGVAPLYVMALFQNSSFRQELGKRATGTSGSMKNISQEKVLEIETIVPPLELQQRFAQQVQVIERLLSLQRRSESKLNALFASLQYHAFQGEL